MTIDHIHALPPGTRFEEYRLDTVLGAGGFGITYRAYDAHLDMFVAIKEYLPGEFAARTEASTVVPKANTDAEDYHWGLTRFLDEARTLARFDHPHLNRVYRFFESNGTAYMVLEYIQGETLADRLTRERQLPEESLQRLLEEVLSGLAVMHEAGYVHRDIKPGNLMLREEDGSAVVLDFGAARQAVGQRSKPITSILTPGYAPAEQYDGKVDRVGPWTDIYALGMVAYRCISGMGDGELPDAVARMLAHTRGDVGLLPAVEAGKGRYKPKLLEAIDWAIEVDEADIKARRLTRPVGNNAWDRYLRVLELEPASPDAIRGMERVIESYGGLFDAALGQEDYDKAAGYLSSIGDLNPDSPVFEEGERRLGAARQARAARLAEIARQRQAEEAARQAELERQRIAQAIETHWSAFGTALQAEDLDEATNILIRVRGLNPEAPGLAAGEQRLAELKRKRRQVLVREALGEMVSIPGASFRMGKYEVTFAQWDACVADGGCVGHMPDDEGWGRGNRPVINVSWDDVQGFIDWLNAKTGGNFRLPTDAEWVYAARAGSTTKFSWGNRIGRNQANCDGCGSRWDDDRTAPVGSFPANVWGLHDMHGNVYEWTQDCEKFSDGFCPAQGGSWDYSPVFMRFPSRIGHPRLSRSNEGGFRLAQDN